MCNKEGFTCLCRPQCPFLKLEAPFLSPPSVRRWEGDHLVTQETVRWETECPWGFKNPACLLLMRHSAPICSIITTFHAACAAILLTFITCVWDCVGEVVRESTLHRVESICATRCFGSQCKGRSSWGSRLKWTRCVKPVSVSLWWHMRLFDHSRFSQWFLKTKLISSRWEFISRAEMKPFTCKREKIIKMLSPTDFITLLNK